MYQQHICPQMPQLLHIPKILDVHLWRKYVNMHAKNDVASINDAARIAVHRW